MDDRVWRAICFEVESFPDLLKAATHVSFSSSTNSQCGAAPVSSAENPEVAVKGDDLY